MPASRSSPLSSPEVAAACGQERRSPFDSAEHRAAFQASFADQNEALSRALGRATPLFAERVEGAAPAYGDRLGEELRSALMKLTVGRLLSPQS